MRSAFTAKSAASQDEIAALLGYMPIIVRAANISEWERQFCASIIGRTKRGAFHPSAKQVDVMRGIVERFRFAAFSDDLVERNE